MRCYASRWKLVGLLGLIGLLVGMSDYCTTLPGLKARVYGWFGLVFFGLGFVVLPIQFFRTGPVVIIDDEGIEDRRSKLGVIPWADIRELSVIRVKSTRFLGVELVDPGKYLARMSRGARALASVNAAMGFPTLGISFAGLTPGLSEAWAALRAKEQAKVAEAPGTP